MVVIYRGALRSVDPPVLHLTLRYAQHGSVSIQRCLLGDEIGGDGGPLRVAVVGKGIVICLRVDSKLAVLELYVDHLLWLLLFTLLRVLSHKSCHELIEHGSARELVFSRSATAL